MSTVLEAQAIDTFAEAPAVPRALDVDSHEMVPVGLRNQIFGPTELQRIIQEYVAPKMPADHPNRTRREVTADDTPINLDTVWTLKGGSAPSAIDLGRRPEVLDLMGIERQLCYPTFGLTGMLLMTDPHAHEFFGLSDEVSDAWRIGRETVDAHNRWAARMTVETNARVRPVGLLVPDTIDSMMAQTETLLAAGIRALMIPPNMPPAGTSPGDTALDPFYRLCAEADVPITIHLGTERGFVAATEWSKNVDVFEPSFQSTTEFIIEPLACTTLHYAPENYLTAMILGGVFERHPTLRFGVIELGATWVGPLAERMDMWAEEMFAKRFATKLSMKPSAYLNRNVRVTPFYFEPVSMYFDRYPHLQDVYCYSTDYPHFEGGADSKRHFAAALASQSDEVRDKFFYRNASLLLPG